MTPSTDPTNRELRRAGSGNGRGVPDLERTDRAARDYSAALVVGCDSRGTRASPMRMAEAYAELLPPREFEPRPFPNGDGYDHLVAVKRCPQPVCAHHLWRFLGLAHVAYMPGARILRPRRSPGCSPAASSPRANDPGDRRLAGLRAKTQGRSARWSRPNTAA